MKYPILGCPILTHSLNVLIWSDFQATLGRDFPTNRAELVRGCWKVIFRNDQGHPTTFSGLKNHGFAVKHRCFSKKNRHFSTMIVFRINLSMFFQEKQAPFFCWSWMAMEKSHCHPLMTGGYMTYEWGSQHFWSWSTGKLRMLLAMIVFEELETPTPKQLVPSPSLLQMATVLLNFWEIKVKSQGWSLF